MPINICGFSKFLQNQILGPIPILHRQFLTTTTKVIADKSVALLKRTTTTWQGRWIIARVFGFRQELYRVKIGRISLKENSVERNSSNDLVNHMSSLLVDDERGQADHHTWVFFQPQLALCPTSGVAMLKNNPGLNRMILSRLLFNLARGTVRIC